MSGKISLIPGTHLSQSGDKYPCTRVPQENSKKNSEEKKRENVFFQSVITIVEIRFRTKTKSRKSYLDEINNLASSPGK